MADSSGPSEGDILRTTLLPPSSLPTVVSLKDFTALFPAELRDQVQISALYRALQHQRALDVDFVRENIDTEAKRGDRQQIELLRSKIAGAGVAEGLDVDIAARSKGESEEQDAAMDDVLYSHHPSSAFEPHTLATILPAMDVAIGTMRDEVAELVAAADQLQNQLEVNIGDLSDLRYGKLSRPNLRKDTIESLKSLSAECDREGASDFGLEHR